MIERNSIIYHSSLKNIFFKVASCDKKYLRSKQEWQMILLAIFLALLKKQIILGSTHVIYHIFEHNFSVQNFRRTKYFVGQNFRNQAKISTILSDKFLSDKVILKKLCGMQEITPFSRGICDPYPINGQPLSTRPKRNHGIWSQRNK